VRVCVGVDFPSASNEPLVINALTSVHLMVGKFLTETH
jgi:hypothetical protein